MRITITLDDALAESLEKAADADGRSVSNFVARLIEEEFSARAAVHDVREAAEATAAIVGSERVLAVLGDMKSGVYAAAGGAV